MTTDQDKHHATFAKFIEFVANKKQPNTEDTALTKVETADHRRLPQPPWVTTLLPRFDNDSMDYGYGPAFKFTDAGTVETRLEWNDEDGTAMAIFVQDTDGSSQEVYLRPAHAQFIIDKLIQMLTILEPSDVPASPPVEPTLPAIILDPAQEILTPEEVARFTRFSPYTLRTWRTAGTGPKSVMLAGRARYFRKDVDAWLQECKEASK